VPGTPAAIDAYLTARLGEYIADAARLCAQPSVSAQRVGLDECSVLVAAMLERRGFDVRRVPTPGAAVVVGRLRGRSDRTMLFYNHYDVQPPEPLDLWTSPPFEPAVRDGALYARGAKDDKGEFVARLAAVDAVRAADGGTSVPDGVPPCGILFVVEGEEEIGSPHIAQFVRDHRDLLTCHGAIWEEGGTDAAGRPQVSLGRRGVLSVELVAETMQRDAHSGQAHVLPNAAWRLLHALATLKGPDERIRIPGFYDAARPASPRDLELLEALPDYEGRLRQTYGVKAFVRDLSGAALSRAVFEPTCNIQGITSGYQGVGSKTVIPARASAKLDFRLVPDQDPRDIFARLRAHLDREGFADVQAIWHGAMWPSKVSPDDPLVSLTARTGEEVYGKPSVLHPMGGGSSPFYAFAQPLGIPVVTAGVGYADNRTHAPDEHVRLGDFLNAARQIARILEAFPGL
jgi:acetylornithine deacetylase/succinyl-diaminopimelate desuccinylase-like protein